MSSGARAQARGKSVMLHVLKSADQGEEESCMVEHTRLLEQKPTFQPPKSRTGDYPLKTNAWFLIRDDDDDMGPKISNILDGIHQDKPIHSRRQNGTVLVGSHLYDIGGCGTTPATMYHLSNQIRRLDWEHIDDGWKSEELPIYCTNPITAVYGDLIYMFPGGLPFTKMREDADIESPPSPWAYVYNTATNAGYDLDLPPNCNDTRPPFCASAEGLGVVLPIEEKQGDLALYLHKTVERVWEKIDGGEETLFSQFYTMPYTVSKGILYAYHVPKNDIGFLYCYKISPWSFIGRIELPEFESLDTKGHSQMRLVPLADYELCILWHRRLGVNEKETQLHYARISVSFRPLAVAVLKQAVFRINALDILNCLPLGEGAEDMLHTGETELIERSHVSTDEQKKQEPEEVDWKGCCMNLQEDLRKKERENQSLRFLLQKHNISPTPNPAQLPKKKGER